jgi:hypothetical protein
MSNKAALVTGAIGVMVTMGCEAFGPRVGQNATVDFGVVRRAEEVTLNSTAAEGALLGGTLGVMLGGRNSRAGAGIRGAAVGGMIGGAAGGDRRGMSYTVEMPGGSSTRVVTDQRNIHVGDCVAVERVSRSANIRRVSPSYCEPGNAQALRAVDADVKAEAVRCDRAKQELAKATSDEAVDLAIRKIELLCDS